MDRLTRKAETVAATASGKSARIRALVRRIPAGRVASYGQIAGYLPGVTPRLVGFAMAGCHRRRDVPWHRVINAAGAISGHAGAAEQRRRLEAEGVVFDSRARVDWVRFGWPGPEPGALIELGLDPEVAFELTGGRAGER